MCIIVAAATASAVVLRWVVVPVVVVFVDGGLGLFIQSLGIGTSKISGVATYSGEVREKGGKGTSTDETADVESISTMLRSRCHT